jgi:anaerobic magnesium-protoporphyrin IX monomethyl ester cyclase
MKLLLVGLGRYLSLFGLRGLSAFLNQRGHSADICFIPVDTRMSLFKREVESFVQFVEEFDPDIVGFSLMFCDFIRAKRLTRSLKERLGAPIIWGGLHPTISPAATPPEVDYICVGEGEIPTLNLLDRLQNKKSTLDIPGICSWNGIRIPDRFMPSERISDLNELPVPDYRPDHHFVLHKGKIVHLDESLMKKYLPHAAMVHPVMTTRGCPYACSFCANSALLPTGKGPHLRRLNPGRVVEEMRGILHQYPYIMGFMMGDDLFVAAPPEWIEEFCALYSKEIHLPFFCEVHPNHVSGSTMAMLREAGLMGVGMGIQSGSERVCSEVFSRQTSRKSIISSVEVLDTQTPDIARYFDIIVDNPYQNADETVETLHLLNGFKRNFELTIFPLLFYPGTALTERALQEGLEINQGSLLTSGESCKYAKSYLNRLLRSLPHAPYGWVKCWIDHRRNFIFRLSFYLFYFGYFVSWRKFGYALRKYVLIKFTLLTCKDKRKIAKRIMPYVRI